MTNNLQQWLHKNVQNYCNEKCAKYLMFDLRKYRGFIFHDTEGWCKIWRKTDLWFGKWQEESVTFLQEHSKVQNWDFNGILLSKVENVHA